jgi:hypothetical protein
MDCQQASYPLLRRRPSLRAMDDVCDFASILGYSVNQHEGKRR